MDVVAQAWDGHQAHGVGDADDVDLLLAHADGLDQDDVGAERVQHVDHSRGGSRESARVAAARHRTDEDALVEEALAHADAVAQDRPAAEGARGIDGDDRDTRGTLAVRAREVVHQGRLPAAGRTGHPHDLGAAGVRVERAQDLGRARVVVLHDAHEPREGTLVARARAGDEVTGRGRRHQDARRRSRAMTMRWTSLVPSPISMRRASRRWRSTAKSRRYPYPPRTCSDASAARVAASDA